ncbi:MAG: hypothetical protein M3Q03_17570 [Chloroflexota bacterium]|nr:hypothetical protein [Chloroflexota bacterium]
MVNAYSLLPVAVRGFPGPEPDDEPEQPERTKTTKRLRERTERPKVAVVFDTESATDRTGMMSGFDDSRWTGLAQSLLFGVARVCRTADWGTLDEYLFYPDDLPEDGVRRLGEAFAAMTWPMADGHEMRDERGVRAHLLSLSEFLKVFYALAYMHRALVVGFNLPFDLARLATDWAPARTRHNAGGWTLTLWRYRDLETGRWKAHPFRPKIAIKAVDSKKAFISFTGTKLGPEVNAPRSRFRGHFLDLRTLAFALTAESYTLKRLAKDLLGIELDKEVEHGIITPEYVAYARRDVVVTARVAESLLAKFDRYAIAPVRGGTTAETKLFSPASMGKAHLRRMGIRQHACSPEVAGYAAAAYFGGWTETPLRLARAPVVLLDFMSMYPTVNALMGLWRYVIADRIDFVDATDEVRAHLDGLENDDVFDPTLWHRMPALVCIEPDGDILPVRAPFDATRNSIGLVPFKAGRSWYMLPDVIAAKLKSPAGKVPKVVQALRMVPQGKQRSLTPTDLAGVPVDPRRDDLFKKVIEERKDAKRGIGRYAGMPKEERDRIAAFHKMFLNSTSYGITAQMNRLDLPSDERQRVTIYSAGEPATVELRHPEEPGPFTFLPLAALIAAAARLMLELLHAEVRVRGGASAFGDTDSMAVVATETGGTIQIEGRGAKGQPIPQTIHALSWADVAEIVATFERLNPYDRTKVPGSVLEIKEENFAPETGHQVEITCLAISAKRYALYRPNGEIAKRSESVLGMLLSPAERAPEDDSDEAGTDWITEVWREALPAVIDGRSPDMPWLDVPAVRRLAVTSPHVMRLVNALNLRDGNHLPKEAQIKPFNFYLVATGERLPTGKARGLVERVPVIGQFERDPTRWFGHRWNRLEDGAPVTFAGELYAFDDDGMPEPGIVPVTMRQFVRDYALHPEGDWLGPDGMPCTRATRGVLQRRPVQKIAEIVIGKEGDVLARKRDDPQTAFGTREVEHLVARGDPWAEIVVPALRLLPVSTVAAECRVSARTVKRWRCGATHPEDDGLVARQLAREANRFLEAVGESAGDPEQDAYTVLSQFVAANQLVRKQLTTVIEGQVASLGMRGLARMLGCPYETVRRWLCNGPPVYPPGLIVLRDALRELECRNQSVDVFRSNLENSPLGTAPAALRENENGSPPKAPPTLWRCDYIDSDT